MSDQPTQAASRIAQLESSLLVMKAIQDEQSAVIRRLHAVIEILQAEKAALQVALRHSVQLSKGEDHNA